MTRFTTPNKNSVPIRFDRDAIWCLLLSR
jgi:hypothetical protein